LSDRFIRAEPVISQGLNFGIHGGRIRESPNRSYFVTVHNGSKPGIRAFNQDGRETWSYYPTWDSFYKVNDMYSGIILNKKENSLIYSVGHDYITSGNTIYTYGRIIKLNIDSGVTTWEEIDRMDYSGGSGDGSTFLM